VKPIRSGRILDVDYKKGDLTVRFTIESSRGPLQLAISSHSAKALVTYLETGSRQIAQAISRVPSSEFEIPDTVDDDLAFIVQAYCSELGPVTVFIESEGPRSGVVMTIVKAVEPTRH
jgi:hypothetical protein